MTIICESCGRSFEVLPIDEWLDGENDFCNCAYCGKRHTAEMCQIQIDAPAQPVV